MKIKGIKNNVEHLIICRLLYAIFLFSNRFGITVCAEGGDIVMDSHTQFKLYVSGDDYNFIGKRLSIKRLVFAVEGFWSRMTGKLACKHNEEFNYYKFNLINPIIFK